MMKQTYYNGVTPGCYNGITPPGVNHQGIKYKYIILTNICRLRVITFKIRIQTITLLVIFVWCKHVPITNL